MKRTEFLFLITALLAANLTAETFEFKFKKGLKQSIQCEINGKVISADMNYLPYSQYQYNQEYKTIRTVTDVKDATFDIEDDTYFYNKNEFETGGVKELSFEKKTAYTKDMYGHHSINKDEILPTLRSIPVFPEGDIKVGDTWISNGIEVQDFYNDEKTSFFPVDVTYKFTGYEEREGKKLAVIEYSFILDSINRIYWDDKEANPDMDKRIVEVVGESKTVMLFDIENGLRVEENYERIYQAHLFDLNIESIVQFEDTGKRIWKVIKLMDKEKEIDEIKEDLKDLDDTKVTEDESGIKLSLENIHFLPDSDEIIPEEMTRIDKIAEILSKYKDRGVLIIGHTTDRGTADGRLVLSKERAKAVLDMLVDRDSVNIEKSAYTGKGGDDPVASNMTEEGMKRNRRVEIIILED